MELLPKEILHEIFSFLDPFSRPAARLVNKKWHMLVVGRMYLFYNIPQKIEQLVQMPDQLALKFDTVRQLNRETIESIIAKIRNLVSLEFNNQDEGCIKTTALDRLEHLKMYRPGTKVIGSLTRLRRLDIEYDYLRKRTFNLATTIEELRFKSVISQEADPYTLFRLDEGHSRLTKLHIDGLSSDFSSITRLTNLRELHLATYRALLEEFSVKTLTNMVDLNIYEDTNAINDIVNLTKLTKLVLHKTYGEADLEKLTQLINLRSIQVTTSNAYNTFWTALTNLEDIQAHSTKENGCTLQHLPIANLTQLTFAVAKGGYFNKNTQHIITRLSNLKTLDVSLQFEFAFNSVISLPNLSILLLKTKHHSLDVKALPRLKVLLLQINQPLQRLDLPTSIERLQLRSSNRTNIKEPVRAEILPNLASLTRLKEFGVYWPNGSIYVIHENISRMTQLESLNLSVENSPLDEELLQSLTNLTELEIYMQLKNNSGNGSFMSNLTNLEHLVLRDYIANNECILGLSKFSNLVHLQVSAQDIPFTSVIQLSYLRNLHMPVQHLEGRDSYYELRDDLMEKLPYLEEYQER